MSIKFRLTFIDHVSHILCAVQLAACHSSVPLLLTPELSLIGSPVAEEFKSSICMK